MDRFTAKISIIGINPYVLVPATVLAALFAQAGRDKGPIPVKGTFDGHPFRQTLVRFEGRWRLYLNTPMRSAAGKDVGASASFELAFDDRPRKEKMQPKLARALRESNARAAFDRLSPSRQKEILRYLGKLKGSEAVERNISSVVAHLLGIEAAATPAFLRAVPPAAKRTRSRASKLEPRKPRG